MKQITYGDAEYAGKRKQMRREPLMIERVRVVPWRELIALIEPRYSEGKSCRPAHPLMTMLRAHLMQSWFGHSEPPMEETLYETTVLRQFGDLSLVGALDKLGVSSAREAQIGCGHSGGD